MTRLEDLRVNHVDCGGSGTLSEHHPKCDGYTCAPGCPVPVPCPCRCGHDAATVSDLVAALQAKGGKVGYFIDMDADVPDEFSPGRYLVFRLEVDGG